MVVLGLHWCVRAFSSCWEWGLVSLLRALQISVVVAHGLGCSTACRIFLDQGSNPHPLHWPVDSYPLCHPGRPRSLILILYYTANCVSWEHMLTLLKATHLYVGDLLYSENYKTLMKQINVDTNLWKYIPSSWTGRINTVKMTILLKAIHRCKAILIKLLMVLMVFFTELEQRNLHICM